MQTSTPVRSRIPIPEVTESPIDFESASDNIDILVDPGIEPDIPHEERYVADMNVNSHCLYIKSVIV